MPANRGADNSSVASAGPRNIRASVAVPPGVQVLRPGSHINPTNNQQPYPPVHGHSIPTGPAAWNGGRSNAGPLPNANRSQYNPSLLRQAQLNTRKGQYNYTGPTYQQQPMGAFNPSLGPAPSQVTQNWRFHGRSPSRASNGSARHPIHNAVCKISNFSRNDFRKGDIIALPFHTANTNPNADPTDGNLAQTAHGVAYSKRRMMVVLWIFQADMFCLPLYSFTGRGISSRPAPLQKEYVAMKNVGDGAFVNHGVYPPVEVQCRRQPMTPATSVHLVGGLRVGCVEDISMVGRLTEQSYVALVALWQALNDQAQNEAWRA